MFFEVSDFDSFNSYDYSFVSYETAWKTIRGGLSALLFLNLFQTINN
jgi:hypothetical protein